jgi:pSer/pThr/pTyr-binding forkhead associated (FHA) protein
VRRWIEDLGSRGGTYLNDLRLTGPQPLADGNQLRVGRTILEYSDLLERRSESELVPSKPEVAEPPSADSSESHPASSTPFMAALAATQALAQGRRQARLQAIEAASATLALSMLGVLLWRLVTT